MLTAEAGTQNATKLKEVLIVKSLWTFLLYFGMEKKEIASMKVGVIRNHYKKLRDKNTPKKEYQKWTELDEAKPTKAMSENVQLAYTALAVERNNHWQKQKQKEKQILVAMVK